MSKVKFYELNRGKNLAKIEREINETLRQQGADGPSVRLFQTADGRVGYSVQVVPAEGGRQLLDLIHRLVCDAVGYKRGRPAGAPAHQVKCRVPQDVYERLVRKAHERRVSPSRLAGELLAREVGT